MWIGQFKKEAIAVVSESIEKGNKPTTTINKLRDFLNNNEECLKHSGAEVIWLGDKEMMEIESYCFRNCKNGFFSLKGRTLRIAIDSVESVFQNTDGEFILKTKNRDRFLLDDFNYQCINLILENGR